LEKCRSQPWQLFTGGGFHQKVNELVKRTMRGSLAVRAWLPPRVSISLALKKPQKLMKGTLYLSEGSCESHHPTGANYFSVELTVLKELSQELADLFGLRLPVSWQQQAHATARDQLVTEPYVTPSLRERVETSSDRDYLPML
jgi:hypothetical protein